MPRLVTLYNDTPIETGRTRCEEIVKSPLQNVSRARPSGAENRKLKAIELAQLRIKDLISANRIAELSSCLALSQAAYDHVWSQLAETHSKWLGVPLEIDKLEKRIHTLTQALAASKDLSAAAATTIEELKAQLPTAANAPIAPHLPRVSIIRPPSQVVSQKVEANKRVGPPLRVPARASLSDVPATLTPSRGLMSPTSRRCPAPSTRQLRSAQRPHTRFLAFGSSTTALPVAGLAAARTSRLQPLPNSVDPATGLSAPHPAEPALGLTHTAPFAVAAYAPVLLPTPHSVDPATGLSALHLAEPALSMTPTPLPAVVPLRQLPVVTDIDFTSLPWYVAFKGWPFEAAIWATQTLSKSKPELRDLILARIIKHLQSIYGGDNPPLWTEEQGVILNSQTYGILNHVATTASQAGGSAFLYPPHLQHLQRRR